MAQKSLSRLFNRSRLSQTGLVLGLAAGILVSSCTGPESTPTATSESTPQFEAQLAEHLSQSGVKMYGAYWCPHCESQKELFGTAAQALPYIECDPAGENAQPELCEAANIPGYPTWEIDGEFYPGVRSLPELAYLSDYEGDVPADINEAAR
jgi:thiol-disulfide isomerase/thioredoxin